MVTPKQYAISPKDTLLAMFMNKKFEILVLTTREAVGKTTPSKQKTISAVRYRNFFGGSLTPNTTLSTRLPKRQMNGSAATISFSSLYCQHTPSQIFATRSGRRAMCCPSLMMPPRPKNLARKIITCNVQITPLSCVHISFDVLRVIINDAFCKAPQATIHTALKATIGGTHVTEMMGESQGWRVWDQAPSGGGG